VIREEQVALSGRLRARITYHVAGDGPPVILLHGWGASWYLWQATMLALAGAGYRALAPDHIGCGQSSKPRLFYTPQDYSAYLNGFLSALGLERVALVGHSLGGHIALSHALAHPQQVERLVLVSPAFSALRQITPTRAQLLLAAAGTPLLGEMGLALLPARLLRWCLGRPWGGFHRPDGLPSGFLDRMTTDYLVHATPLVCNSIRYLVLFSLPILSRLRQDADLLPRVGRVTMPVLLVWGEHDARLRPGAFPILSTHLPHAQAMGIADAGHTPPLEAPEEFQAALIEYLRTWGAARTAPPPGAVRHAN